VIQCPVCRIVYISNTIFCPECGAYLLPEAKLDTDPMEAAQIRWPREADEAQARDAGTPDAKPLTLRLRIGQGDWARTLEVSLVKPIRLGRNDPAGHVFPEIDLTSGHGRQYGVSRQHACIFQRGETIEVQDLASTNGTLLNGERLAPYVPEPLKDGDQLQLGKLLIEVSLVPQPS
jgi:pSer/pThr/pTyr-binding forkhead associated (FHA) protein